MCAQTTYKTMTSGLLVLEWVLILCMCRYLGGSDFWVPDVPLYAGINHTFHASVPDDTLVVHYPDVEWCYCDMGQFGDTCTC